MTYCCHNFKTKKELKQAVEDYDLSKLRIYEPGIGLAVTHGWVDLEGPHAPAPHTWYAEAWVMDGIIREVR